MSAGWQGGSSRRWRALRAWVLKRDQYRCQLQLPGCTIDAPLEGGHVDHIAPLDKGGDKWDPNNCRATCRRCNLSRGRGDRMGYEPDYKKVSSW